MRGRGVSAGRPTGRSSELGGEQVEGIRAVAELLRAGRRRVRQVWVARGDEIPSGDAGDAHPDPIAEIVRAAQRSHVDVEFVDRQALHHAALTESPQGVVAWAEPLEGVTLDELCEVATGAQPFLVVVEGVTDPRNVGSLARTALSAGATGMVLPRHRAAHITPAAGKSAAGAIEHLPFAIAPGIPAALVRLSEREVWSVGLDPDAELSIYDVDLFDGPVALVLGAEGRGLSRLTARRCDLLAAIPQSGPLGSLNVSAAGAIACFEVARRRASVP